MNYVYSGWLISFPVEPVNNTLKGDWPFSPLWKLSFRNQELYRTVSTWDVGFIERSLLVLENTFNAEVPLVAHVDCELDILNLYSGPGGSIIID